MQRVLSSWLVLLSVAIAAPAGHAIGFVFDSSAFYFNDSMSYNSATSTYSRVFWDVCPGMGLDHRARLVLGWNYDSMSFTDNPGTATALTVTDMGPKLEYFMDKDRAWDIGFVYNLITTANYSSGSTTAQLRGTSMRFDLGYAPELVPGIMMGGKINYYRASFNEQIVSTTLTKVTNGRTAIYPSVAFTFRWD